MLKTITTVMLIAMSSAALAQDVDPGDMKAMGPYMAKCPGVVDDQKAMMDAIESSKVNADQATDPNDQLLALCSMYHKVMPIAEDISTRLSYCAHHELPILGSAAVIFDQGFTHGFAMRNAAQLCGE